MIAHLPPEPIPYVSEITEAAERYAIPLPIAIALVRVESGYNPRARSRAGAVGLTQLMPRTARLVCSLPRRDLLKPAKNLDCGFAYLSRLYVEYGSWYHALIAYNQGSGRTSRALARGFHFKGLTGPGHYAFSILNAARVGALAPPPSLPAARLAN